MDINSIIKRMTLEEKVKITSGKTFWLTHDFPHLNIPSLKMSDGPFGVRYQKDEGDHLGVHQSEPATCFPTSTSLASSWDVDLVERVGQAIGHEAKSLGVHVVLGPGVNIKRNPLCGRNFEYFSEDPLVSGRMGAAWIKGVQSCGVGGCVKHFMANNQENQRLRSNSIVDARAIHEMYLRPFEIVINESSPASLMTAYNQVNGIYMSDHKYLIHHVLRKKLGYKGVVMTDWGGLNDKVTSIMATNDLEMPTSNQMFDQDLIKAVQRGEVDESVVDASVHRILTLVNQYGKTSKTIVNVEDHHQLARLVATQGAVLLKNEDQILPLHKQDKVALIGQLAEDFRYQGSGSSHIQPTKVDSIVRAFSDSRINFDYFDGYDVNELNSNQPFSSTLLSYDACVVVLGLPDAYESEGYDREHSRLPQNQLNLLKGLAKIRKDLIVVLLGGSPVDCNWTQDAKAILHMHLSGQAGGLATVDLLYGDVNPSGKLTETYWHQYSDVVSSAYYNQNPRIAQYRESIYVGYRYADKISLPVAFPFGFGLSYTTFDLSDVRVERIVDTYRITLTINNTGSVIGKEVVQCYVSNQCQQAMVTKQLAGFLKVELSAKEKKQISFELDERVFMFYSEKTDAFEPMGGTFLFEVGNSSRNICFHQLIDHGSIHPELIKPVPDWYSDPVVSINQSDFEVLIGHKIQDSELPKVGSYSLMSTLEEMKKSLSVRVFTYFMKKELLRRSKEGKDSREYQLLVQITTNTPLKRLAQQSSGIIPLSVFNVLVFLANHHI